MEREHEKEGERERPRDKEAWKQRFVGEREGNRRGKEKMHTRIGDDVFGKRKTWTHIRGGARGS